jgi:hypothetical protein
MANLSAITGGGGLVSTKQYNFTDSQTTANLDFSQSVAIDTVTDVTKAFIIPNDFAASVMALKFDAATGSSSAVEYKVNNVGDTTLEHIGFQVVVFS